MIRIELNGYQIRQRPACWQVVDGSGKVVAEVASLEAAFDAYFVYINPNKERISAYISMVKI